MDMLTSRLRKVEEASRAREEIQQLEREVIRSAEDARWEFQIFDKMGALYDDMGRYYTAGFKLKF